MDVFKRFVRENVDRPQTVKAERVLILSKELEKEFEHYCRKQNLGFNEAVVMLLEAAINSEQKIKSEQDEKNSL